MFVGNITIFRILYDCKDLWERKKARVSCGFLLPVKSTAWRKCYTRKKRAFTKLLGGDSTLISVQDVKTKIGCRWELFQFVKHREKDSRRVKVGKSIFFAKDRFAEVMQPPAAVELEFGKKVKVCA